MNRLIIITIRLLLILLLGFFALHPQYQELTTLKEQIQEKEEQLRSQEDYLNKLSEASEELKKYEEQLVLIDTALPSEPSLPALFDFLEKTASQSGLILKDIDASTSPSVDSVLKETTISVKATGAYSSFKNFISVLEKSARIMSVASFSFDNSKEKGDIFDLGLTIKTHSY